MKANMMIKLAIDFIMTVLLLFAFAYQLTGNLGHELVGMTMFILFFAHHALNWRWFQNIDKGRQSIRRLLGNIANILLSVIMIFLAVSSVMISREVFAFLNLNGGITMRQLHTTTAYWGFILMSVHLGMHGNMVIGAMRKMTGISSDSRIRTWLLRAISFVIGLWGIRSSFQMEIGSHLFLQYTFGYWDFETAAVQFFVGYASIMGLYAILTHYVLKGIQRIARNY